MWILNDRYVIDEQVEARHGGMADVHLAVDMHDSRAEVAIKLFRADFDSDAIVNEIFARESRALYAFDHPNIVKVMDFGKDARTQRRFLVLEWLARDLIAQIDKKPYASWDEFFSNIGQPVLDALSYAFEKGYAHRDLKPQNILLDPTGVAKVVDFGISKLRDAISPAGRTVRDFVSRPYTPPEIEDPVARDTRDVFSFAALAVHSLAGGSMTTYEDLDDAFKSISLRQSVRSILTKALSRHPTERPANVNALLEDLTATAARPLSAGAPPLIYLAIPRNVGERVQKQLGLTTLMALEGLVNNELTSEAAYRLRDPTEGGIASKIIIYGQEHVLTTIVDQVTKDHLVLMNVVRRRASEIGRDRENAIGIEARFAISRPPASQATVRSIEAFVQKLAEHEESIKQKDLYRAEETIFRTWLNVLRAKDDLETGKEHPIRFNGVEIIENRIAFKTERVIDDSIVGQNRLVRLPLGRALRGEVESVRERTVTLWTERRWHVDDIPRRGDLVLDTTVGRIPVQRQLDALAATRFGRARRPELRNFLIDPSTVFEPQPDENISFYQNDLDEDKQSAVRIALANRDVVVVHGPPGTGKTKLITEVVTQVCRRNPKARVLLTSQTNVALDNALERLRAIAPDLQTVRIGRRDDPRISHSIRDLLLDNKSAAWIKEIRKKNDDFLNSWAIQNNVRREDVQLGIAAGRLKTIRQREDSILSEQATAKLELAQLSEQLKELEERRTSDTYFDVNAKIEKLNTLAEGLDSQLEAIGKDRREGAEVLRKLGSIGQDLAKMTVPDLTAWEEGLLDQGESGRRFRLLVELSEEWLLRLARPEEFHPAFLLTAQVVAGTCIGIAGVKGINALEFDVCILDEASKALATESLVPMALASSWILVGDERQLPPFVDSALDDRAVLHEYGLTRRDLEDTVFSRFSAQLPARNIARLTSQYRMVKPIGNLVSECFYEGTLDSKREASIEKLRYAFTKPVTWYSTVRHPSREETRLGTSFQNGLEAKLITDVVRRINFVGNQLQRRFSIAIITGYRAQVQEIVTRVSGLGNLEYVTVECNSVDAFQGREADITLYSITRCNDKGDIGFLSERRRLNVALSRGREGLVIVGDHRFCESAPGENPFASVIRYMNRNQDSCLISPVDA